MIRENFFSHAELDIFRPILDSLVCDTYMIAADFDSYAMAQERI